jgi:formyltetrahydrofolate deformylase
MVSQHGHCLNDLLFRWRSGLLPVELQAIVSNHRDFEGLAASYGVPFHHLPVTAASKQRAEARLMDMIETGRADLLVLARYMQVLSDELCRRIAGPRDQHPPFLPSELQGERGPMRRRMSGA